MIGDTAPKRWRLAVDALAVLTAFALLLSGWALYSRFTETNHARADNRAVWHAVICSLERATMKQPHVPPARVRTVLVFYDKLLVEDVHAAPCGLVSEVK